MIYNNDFSHDLEVGQVGERFLGRILDGAKIEVKTDLQALRTRNVSVEYESRGNPSGLARTQAEYWTFVLSEEVMIMVETSKLKDICRVFLNTNRDIKGGDSNTSKGILLEISKLFKL